MISQKLSEARVYEIKKEAEIAIENRPVFHLTPRVGWLNDPNGFSFYDGLCRVSLRLSGSLHH